VKTASGLPMKVLKSEVVDKSTAHYWSGRIRSAMGATVAGILNVGQELSAAKKACAHGEFGRLFDPTDAEFVGFSWQTGDKFMSVARHDAIRNPAHARDLPPSWYTLYQLSQAPAEQVEEWIAAGDVTPGMQRKDVARLLRGNSPPPKPTPPLPVGTYRTIVADPPWAYDEGWPEFADSAGAGGPRIDLPYQSLDLDGIFDLDVEALAADDAHLFLWTTNRYLRDSYNVAEAWGFKPSEVLVWCKPPRGIGPGGIFSNTAEFVLYARRGKPTHTTRVDSTWWQWPRGRHSAKPAGFLDLIEATVPGPYLEMFARDPRPGWEAWGLEA
jgi:N6-adenosine-specific RNA methylase IME4